MPRLALQIDPSKYIDVPIQRGAPKDIRIFVEGFMEYLADRMVYRIREVVRKQEFKATWSQNPLSDQHKAFKKKFKLSPKFWFASGELSRSIIWWHSKKDNLYYVGAHPQRRHSKYKRPRKGEKKGGVYVSKRQQALMWKIILWLELGTRTCPPRPLFGPVLREMKKDLKKHYQDYITKTKKRKTPIKLKHKGP